MGQGRKYPDEGEYERMLRLQEWGEQGYMEDLDSQMGDLDLSDNRPQELSDNLDVSDKRPQDVSDTSSGSSYTRGAVIERRKRVCRTVGSQYI